MDGDYSFSFSSDTSSYFGSSSYGSSFDYGLSSYDFGLGSYGSSTFDSFSSYLTSFDTPSYGSVFDYSPVLSPVYDYSFDNYSFGSYDYNSYNYALPNYTAPSYYSPSFDFSYTSPTFDYSYGGASFGSFDTGLNDFSTDYQNGFSFLDSNSYVSPIFDTLSNVTSSLLDFNWGDSFGFGSSQLGSNLFTSPLFGNTFDFDFGQDYFGETSNNDSIFDLPPIDFGLPTPNLFAPPSYEIDLGLGSFNDGLINTTPVISDQWWDSISSSISDAFLTTNVFDFSTDEFDVFDFETIQVPEVNIPPSSGLTFEDQATTFINLPTDYYISNQWNMALPQSQEIQGGEFGWMTGSYYEALTAPNYNFSAGEGYISDGQVDPYLQYASQNDGGYLMPVSQNGGGTLWNRFWANAPSAPQWLVDSVAGFGDGLSKTFTFGLVSTEDVRSWLGIGSVDTNSGAYTAGEVSGMVWASLTGVAGSANGGANTVLWSNGGLPGNAKTVAVEFGTTLEMTPLGRFLEGLQQKGVDIPMKVWEASSAIFAMNAKGEVSVVLGGINANSVLMRIELPILNARGVGFVIKP